MKPGDLVKIVGNTAPMYPDHVSQNWLGDTSHIGYATPGTLCVLLNIEEYVGSSNLIFYRLLTAEHGPVWVRSIWVKEEIDETR